MRRPLAAVLAVVCLSALTGCEWRGLNSLSLPGTEGGGDGSYTIQAQLPDVVVIQQNTRVRVADVNVGNVTKIEVQDWHALVTMRINKDVHLPANSTAKVGTTSLLGSMHIELAPPTDEPPEGELKNGSLIPLSAASTYPTTEQTLASVSILLNGGGLGQLQEINQTFAKALAGRENDMRSLLTQLDVFIEQLNDQTDDIITATESLNALAGQVAAKDRDRRQGAHHDPAGDLGAGGVPREAGRRRRRAWQVQRHRHSTVNQTKESLVANLRNIAPVLRELAERRARAHQGAGLPVDLPVGEEHHSQLVPGRLRQHHARHRPHPEQVGRRLVHRDEVGRRSHRTRTAVGSHDRPEAEPVHGGQPACRPVSLGGVLTWCGCPAQCGFSWRSWRRSR